jgi:L-iditol 2-dehydrogenase
VVVGAGCIGLVTMMALKAEGVTRVYVVDIIQKRLDKALELEPQASINGKEEDVVEACEEAHQRRRLRPRHRGGGPNRDKCQSHQIFTPKEGATIVLVGYTKTGAN